MIREAANVIRWYDACRREHDCQRCALFGERRQGKCESFLLGEAVKALGQMLRAEAKRAGGARWKRAEYPNGTKYSCSCCGGEVLQKWEHCPDCGAMMLDQESMEI